MFLFLQLDDWVLCRIYKKKNTARVSEDIPIVEDFQTKTLTAGDDDGTNDVQMMDFPRTSSISHLWELEYLGSISQLLNENYSYNSSYDHQNSMTTNAGLFEPARTVELGDADSMKFQMNNQSSMLKQPVFVNPVFEF